MDGLVFWKFVYMRSAGRNHGRGNQRAGCQQRQKQSLDCNDHVADDSRSDQGKSQSSFDDLSLRGTGRFIKDAQHLSFLKAPIGRVGSQQL